MTLDVRARPRRRVVAGALVGALALLAVGVPPADAYPRPGATERVSVASDGTVANGDSWSNSGDSAASISADGRHVAFMSRASNLVPGDTNDAWDVFVHDRETGTTERVSVATDGTQGNAWSQDPSISTDGRYVAFMSFASNLVPGDTNGMDDIFVHDRETAVTEQVSVATDGTEGNSASFRPRISADGRHVAFFSHASNLVPGDTNDAWDVFVHDRETGVTERVSVATDGTEGNSDSWSPSISADGRHVAFYSHASNLVPEDTNGHPDVFVHDRETGATERISVATDGAQGNHASAIPAISADGRHVAFFSAASNLVPGDTNDTTDGFVHDRETGVTERISVASDGTESNDWFGQPAISADGRYVVFISGASNLVPGDTNQAWDVFVHDRETAATERVSLASDGTEGNADAKQPSISADGRYVAFHSDASNLVPGETNDASDVFVRDRGPAIGVGSLATRRASDELTVSGWATFSGTIVASAEDPADDGAVGARELGAEIIGASVTYRPEQEDLLLRLAVASLPHLSVRACPTLALCLVDGTGGGAPGIVYRWSFTASGSVYEVRALRAEVTAYPPTTDPHFTLYACTDSCTEIEQLSGGIGTTGHEVRVSVPLQALGAGEDAELTDIEASATLEEAAPGPLVVLDDVALPDASIPVPRVELGIAPPSASQADVVFSVQTDLVEGRFSATVDASSLPPGAHRVWARACLAQTCGAAWVEVVG